MDIVVVAVAMAVGATLASLSTVLIAAIKRFISNQDDNQKVIIGKFDYNEISELTIEELDKIIYDVEQLKRHKLKALSEH